MHIYSLFITDFEVKNVTEAVKVSTILKIIANMEDIPKDVANKLEYPISQMTSKYLYNESVTDCMSALSASSLKSTIPSMDLWIQQLPEILVSSKVTQCHINAIIMLFKRKDATLIEGFSKLNSTRKYI